MLVPMPFGRRADSRRGWYSFAYFQLIDRDLPAVPGQGFKLFSSVLFNKKVNSFYDLFNFLSFLSRFALLGPSAADSGSRFFYFREFYNTVLPCFWVYRSRKIQPLFAFLPKTSYICS